MTIEIKMRGTCGQRDVASNGRDLASKNFRLLAAFGGCRNF